MFWLVSCALAADVRDGDLVFHHSDSAQSAFLEQATGSRWTHVGVVTIGRSGPEVLEAVEPVKLTPLATWAARASDGRIAIRRLARADEVLTVEIGATMRALGQRWLGGHYDSRFAWSDDRLYCSELVHKLFLVAGVALGTPHPMRDFDLSNPAVRAAAEARFGLPLPLDEPVVAPVDVYLDPELVSVCEGTVAHCLGS